MRKKIPFVAISNDELEGAPPAKKGDKIKCPKCGGIHTLKAGTDKEGNEVDVLLYYKCGDTLRVGAVGGRLHFGAEPVQ